MRQRSPLHRVVGALVLLIFMQIPSMAERIAALREGRPEASEASRLKATSLAISGPNEVEDNSKASFNAIATYSDGSTRTVTFRTDWSENSNYTSISANGVLTVLNVPGDQTVTVSASYGRRGNILNASKSVHIVDKDISLTSLALQGSSVVAENSSATYTAVATFSNGSTKVVTADAVWSENSPYASISGGTLTTAAVTGNQPATVSASYVYGGITRTASISVTITDAGSQAGSHTSMFDSYIGTATCLNCHASEATAFHQSVHYQWQGDASESQGLHSPLAGKLGGINDFCIYPDINWLGKLTNLDGEPVDGGCARCHGGLGLKPNPIPDQAQLENIDCLLCHSPQYKRTLQQEANGQFRFVADIAKMNVSLLAAAQDIRKPTTETCLSCHAHAGGGNNFKRGDLEAAHSSATRSFDVHMASRQNGGAGLSCLSCHTTSAHRIAGRGIDLRERDIPDVVRCANCHGAAPHDDARINRHTARVNCNVCHIPEFAKIAPTDMFRDWSAAGDVNPATRLYEPHMRMQSHVSPVYGFFNGNSRFYQFGTPATPGANGKILMAGPLGSIQDPGAKIQAMKYHEGLQPIDPVSRVLLPLKIGIFFQTGDINTAVAKGAEAMGWGYSGHQFASTERFMGLYHEVAPKEQALSCSSCHGGGRLNFAELGYTPRSTRNGVPLCASCHSSKSASFTETHKKHVTDKKYDCSYCHTFSKAIG